MRKNLGVLAAILLLAGCTVGSPVRLSGPAVQQDIAAEDEGLLIGLVADSQLQTRRNYNVIPFYRGRREDGAFNVSMRPPALDWAARHMLRYELDALANRGAKTIFYLGDGANNGCYDEFAFGFEDGMDPAFKDQGILRILSDFREQSGVAVYFVIGNHDILGAGSTSDNSRRERFCEDLTDGESASLLKSEVIEIVERFNRGSAQIGGGWTYRSSYQQNAIVRDCGSDSERQHRRWGCYLAATLDGSANGKPVQFLLLDTTDFASVSLSEPLPSIDQEGMRGAMSFGVLPGEETLSQTSWFDRHASKDLPLRIALSHYDVTSLTKRVGPIQLSRKSQRYADLFLGGENGRDPLQEHAYAISAHTHSKDNSVKDIGFRLDCGLFFCRPGGNVSITELNIGSTTDFANYATLVKISPENTLSYQRIEGASDSCRDVYDKLEAFDFSKPFRDSSRGWGAIGIDDDKRYAYRDFTFAELAPLWANLEEFVGEDPRTARCIGLYAAAIEHGADPMAQH